MKPDGVLAVHISNRYLDLAPVVAAAAVADGKDVRLVDNDDDDRMESSNRVMSWLPVGPGFFDNPLLEKVATTIKLPPGMRRWTDDYSNLWQALKFDD